MARQEILEVYRALENEMWAVRIAMTLDHQLRFRDSESTDLLNRAAGRAFYYVVFFVSRDLVWSMRRLLAVVDKHYEFGPIQRTIEPLKGSTFGNLVDLGGQEFNQRARCLRQGEVPSDLDNLFWEFGTKPHCRRRNQIKPETIPWKLIAQ